MTRLQTYARTALALLLGERCVVCGDFLPGAMVCPKCTLKIPYYHASGERGNPLERLFWGRVPVSRAHAMMVYHPGNDTGRILHAIKYRGRSDLACEMGRWVAQELSSTDFFEGIDALQPVPLHPIRQRERGYNQSECIARGIAELTGLPIVSLVKRICNNTSQTQLSHEERQANVEGIFAPDHDALRRLQPRHVLIVDDVITTGATTVHCAQALTGLPGDAIAPAPHLKVSFVALALAGHASPGRLTTADLRLPDYEEDGYAFRTLQQPDLF